METDDILKEIRDSLQRLEKDISATGSSHSAPHLPRPTEQFPKVELAIDRAVGKRAEKCEILREKIVEEKMRPLSERLARIEAKIEEIRQELGGKINGVKADAAKTSTGAVVSLTDKVDKLADVVLGTRGEPGLEESVRNFEEWIDRYEVERMEAAEKSKFKVSTFIQIVGIIVAIGLGVAGLLLR